MEKPNMSLVIAKEFLGASIRHPNTDAGFTNATEVVWVRDGRHVAYGLFNTINSGALTVANVKIDETKRFTETNFNGDEASSLKDLGRPVEEMILSEMVHEYTGSDEETHNLSIRSLVEETPCENCGNESLDNACQFCAICGTRNPNFDLAVFTLNFNAEQDEKNVFTTAGEAAKACQDPSKPWFHQVANIKSDLENDPDEEVPEIGYCLICGKKL